ncbi:DUF5365 family protein [Heyndrickxia acidiproducens]|uniref:DUF5365 family protein n=1 Tax=Heyndrickxia acidiproducens TaxID=1121084 RepID=UPI000372DE93|nr:DUF5365 family protein [Heyndrickxia acidiproducens]
MKVVFASTEDQIEKIEELVQYMYTEVFPKYFNDEQIVEYQASNVLSLSDSPYKQIGTLKEGYQIISSLQTIISILEAKEKKKQYYIELFEFNKYFLEQNGLHFPFSFSQFSIEKNNGFSIFNKAANRLLI